MAQVQCSKRALCGVVKCIHYGPHDVRYFDAATVMPCNCEEDAHECPALGTPDEPVYAICDVVPEERSSS